MKITKRHIFRTTIILIIVYFIWTGFLIKHNTFIAISDYVKDNSNYDIEIIVDNKSIIKDTVSLKDYGWPGKIHLSKINSGFHKIIVRSNSLEMIDSANFISIGNSHIYIEFVKNTFDEPGNILIDKRFGKKIIFE